MAEAETHKGDKRCLHPNVAVLFARRLVFFTSLNCVFPNLEDFILGQQTSELYVLENFCCYYNARNCCCGTRIRNIKDHQCARAFDRGAIKRGQFTPDTFNYFSGCFLPLGCRVVQNIAESFRCVFSCHPEVHGELLSRLMQAGGSPVSLLTEHDGLIPYSSSFPSATLLSACIPSACCWLTLTNDPPGAV